MEYYKKWSLTFIVCILLLIFNSINFDAWVTMDGLTAYFNRRLVRSAADMVLPALFMQCSSFALSLMFFYPRGGKLECLVRLIYRSLVFIAVITAFLMALIMVEKNVRTETAYGTIVMTIILPLAILFDNREHVHENVQLLLKSPFQYCTESGASIRV